MSCEHVKDLLSAYLDNMLTTEERELVATHLKTCISCCALLEDLRRIDAILVHLPRVEPAANLRRRIFSSPEYLELTGTYGDTEWIDELTTAHAYRRNHPNGPHLVALTGGRQGPTRPLPYLPHREPDQAFSQERVARTLRIMQVLIAACILLTLSMGAFIGWNLTRQQGTITRDTTAITPPAGFIQGPISAGTRFVFLRDGALWSAASDGRPDITRLTPANTTVAANWAVRPPLPGRPAGDRVAYIDLQQGRVHIIRSDGQNDTAIQPALLGANVQPTAVWDTQIGSTLLNSLSWAPDGSMLAFVADPKGTGKPGLYIFSTMTATTQTIALPTNGSVSHLTWSPDSIRLTYVVSQNSSTSIFDYNTQNHGVLTIAQTVSTSAYPSDTVQSLDWSPIVDTPEITWSVGAAGHVHSIWIQRVGLEGPPRPYALITGDYVQATYSRDHAALGSWLLVNAHTGTTGDVMSIDLAAHLNRFTYGKQASFAQWSPDGAHVTYFDAFTSGIGALHIITTATGSDLLESANVISNPSPTWSPDSQYLAYSTGTRIITTRVQALKTTEQLKLQGPASVLSWSATSTDKLILGISDEQPGIYLVDTQHNTSLRLDQKDLSGPILWTQIP